MLYIFEIIWKLRRKTLKEMTTTRAGVYVGLDLAALLKAMIIVGHGTKIFVPSMIFVSLQE
jgi:hypothetical protein